MKLTPQIQKAINFAAQKHHHQQRKTSDPLPYISHVFSVTWILNSYTEDEDIIIAGLLHDVLEDVPEYSAANMKQDFGERVTAIVEGVTEMTSAGGKTFSWQERKNAYLTRLAGEKEESLLVCAADKIHNINSLVAGYEREGESFWQRFESSKKDKLEFYRKTIMILKEKLVNPIVEELEEVYRQAIIIFS